MSRQLIKTIKTNWYTPPEIIEPIRAALGGYIDLDVASCKHANKLVKANEYLTEYNDYLTYNYPVLHLSVFMNPPYTRGVIDKFVYKLINDTLENDWHSIMLVPSNTSSKWCQYAIEHSNLVCFVSPRIKFIDGDTFVKSKRPDSSHLILEYNGYSVSELSKLGVCK